ncbi:hypothetical protein ACFVYP_25035 [Kitasatospora sp. NPDC058201]|uniref:hypothetical protein n=1 Tax=Streptomycetaceae TaxID=2062 RepID=UPI002E7662D6|nr:hypothetical protein [Streptomyces sp. BE303]MED7953826.1 hypothetical protein [Streptomyces sp. BE303]
MTDPDIPVPANPAAAPPVRPELVAVLVEAADAPPAWASRVTPQARLDGDLLLDETEIGALDGLLRARFGPAADLGALRSGLDLAGLEALTVADVERLLPAEDAR